MKVSKKAMSVALCTVLLSGGGLASLANVAHADSNNAIYSRSISQSWTETLHLRLKRKVGCGTTTLKLNLISNNNKLTLQLGNNSIPDIYDYKFDDDYLLGIKNFYGVEKDFSLNNKNIGPFKDGSVMNEVNNLIKTFNNLNITLKDSSGEDIMTLFYAHGRNSDDSLTFSGQDITRPTTTRNYDKGYKSRGIDKWTHGFELKARGIYECSFMHRNK